MSKPQLKRYLLFMGYVHDSSGGWADFVKDFDSADDAEKYAKDHKYIGSWWYQVIDKVTGEQVAHYIKA